MYRDVVKFMDPSDPEDLEWMDEDYGVSVALIGYNSNIHIKGIEGDGFGLYKEQGALKDLLRIVLLMLGVIEDGAIQEVKYYELVETDRKMPALMGYFVDKEDEVYNFYLADPCQNLALKMGTPEEAVFNLGLIKNALEELINT